LRKNQRAIITILDEPVSASKTKIQALLESMKGKYPELSSKDFAARE
jgi:hypothetical protein